MALSTLSAFSPYSVTAFMILFLTQNPVIAFSETLRSDIEVLRSFRQSIDPNTISTSTFLRTWNFGVDPCESPGPHFLGVLCTVPDGNSSSRIAEINLEGDGLEGFLSPTLGNLTELTLLNLRRNKFRGPIPDSLINITKITGLLLSENFLSGNIPDGFRGLKKLEILDLSRNRLSGSIPASVSNIRRLTQLILSNNEFSGRIPDLTGLWQLDTLDLGSNQLSGNLPDFPNNLRSLLLGRNLLSGHISTVDRLQRLVELDLSDNRFSGEINQGVLTLPELRRVYVSANRFTEIEARKMSNRPSQLQAIGAQRNRISGHLPLNLITYENLTSVNLGHNLFSGEIPAEYGERVRRGYWRSLFLDHNWLEGNVPSGLIQSTLKGSLAHNCVNCKHNMPICHGGQRPPAECLGRSQHYSPALVT